MYAVIEVGGKQYVVEKDDILEVERQGGSEGKEISLNKVLLVSHKEGLKIGQPYVKEAKVLAHVEKHMKGNKVISYKYRRRKGSHWTKGHRQQLTRIKIKNIEVG